MTDPDRKRAMKRIRRAVTNALDWHEIALFAGAGDPDEVEAKRLGAVVARCKLDKIIREELDRCTGTTK